MENRLSAVLAAREAEGRQMASLLEPDVPEVVSGGVTQAEQPQQPVSPAINDKKSVRCECSGRGDRAGTENETGRNETATATRDQ
ncbi:hypothetical protein ACLBOM_35005 [Escherichia coli]